MLVSASALAICPDLCYAHSLESCREFGDEWLLRSSPGGSEITSIKKFSGMIRGQGEIIFDFWKSSVVDVIKLSCFGLRHRTWGAI